MLQYTQTHLTTPSNAIELAGTDLMQISGSTFGPWGGPGFGLGGPGFGCGCLPPPPPCCDGFGWGGGFGGFGGLNNTIIININSFNTNRRRRFF